MFRQVFRACCAAGKCLLKNPQNLPASLSRFLQQLETDTPGPFPGAAAGCVRQKERDRVIYDIITAAANIAYRE
jgi:hypothetical protein